MHNVTLYEMRDSNEVKRVRFFASLECDCATCKTRNGAIFPIEEAIALVESEGVDHSNCGKWLPMRER